MTGQLPRGADKIASFEVSAHRRLGDTLLHITDRGLILASAKRGVVFDLGWELLCTATPRGKRIVLTWDSASSVRLTYGFAVKEIEIVMDALLRFNAQFASQQTFTESLRTTFADDIAKVASKERTEFGPNSDMWHPTTIPEDAEIILDSSIRPVIASRHGDVPARIPDEYVWNDAWYDASAGCFFTHNALFKKIGGFTKRAEQIRHKSVSDDGSVTLEGIKIKFLFGYPATMLSWDGDGGPADAWTLLPTVHPEMLTPEMVRAKTDTDPSAHNLNYATDSLAVYEPRFHASVSVYEAILYNDGMRRHASTKYPSLVARLNYLRENVPAEDGLPAGAADGGHYDAEIRAHEDPYFAECAAVVSGRTA